MNPNDSVQNSGTELYFKLMYLMNDNFFINIFAELLLLIIEVDSAHPRSISKDYFFETKCL